MTTKTKDSIQCSATLSQVQTTDGKEYWMLANTGQPMRVGGWDKPVIVEMAGVKFLKESTPIFYSHSEYDIIGTSTDQRVLLAGETFSPKEGQTFTGPAILVKWKFTNSTGLSKEIRENIDNGFLYEVSIGGRPQKLRQLDEEQSETVNGIEVTGPLVIAEEILIQESSICAFGACPGTRNLAASKPAESEMKMDEARNLSTAGVELEAGMVPPAGGLKENFPTPEISAEEKERVMKIEACAEMCTASAPIRIEGGEFADVNAAAKYAIRSGVTADEFKLACRKASLERPAGPAIHSVSHDVTEGAIEASILKQFAREYKIPLRATLAQDGITEYGLEAWFDEKTLEASDRPELKNITLHGVFDLLHEQVFGCSYRGTHRSDSYFQAVADARLNAAMSRRLNAAGPSALNLPYLWSNTAKKIILSTFDSVPTTWQNWVHPISVPDFKAYELHRFTAENTLSPVGQNGVLEQGSAESESFSVKTDTYGKAYSASRQMMYNDDLGAIVRLWAGVGITGPTTIEESAYLLILQNFSTYFNAGNSNLVTGANYALSLEALDDVSALYKKKVDAYGKPILDIPDRIITGSALGSLAKRIYSQDTPILQYDTGQSGIRYAPLQNEFVGKFLPIESPYLDNTAIKQTVYKETRMKPIPNQSSTLWFMATNPASPNGAAFYLPCLNGNPVPHVETCDTDPLMLGTAIKVYADFKVVAGDVSRMIAITGADA